MRGRINEYASTIMLGPDGKYYMTCHICGKKAISTMGFKLDFHVRAVQGSIKMAVCHKCEPKIRPLILELLQEKI